MEHKERALKLYNEHHRDRLDVDRGESTFNFLKFGGLMLLASANPVTAVAAVALGVTDAVNQHTRSTHRAPSSAASALPWHGFDD